SDIERPKTPAQNILCSYRALRVSTLFCRAIGFWFNSLVLECTPCDGRVRKSRNAIRKLTAGRRSCQAGGGYFVKHTEARAINPSGAVVSFCAQTQTQTQTQT
ncbi:MAG: hypothetical protein ACI83B_003725, partial [Sediminicola sp.]